MNHSIATADRTTHLKVVVVALIAAIAVATVGIAARINTGVELAGVRNGQPAYTQAGVVKAGKSAVWTQTDQITIR